MGKWYFPCGIDIEKESVHNARIETFKDNILTSLARETCQNSLDAQRNERKPVLVEIIEKTIQPHEILDKGSFIGEIIPKSRETWRNDLKARDFLDKYENILRKGPIGVLRISDFNTTGLEDANWESLIEKAGSSAKNNVGSAGSFGIGKAAPFASSDLRMVFYNTVLEKGQEKSIGVTKFISFDNEDGTTAQGVGYLGGTKKEPIDEQLTFGFNKREESGTDIYIIGFNQKKNWQNIMITSILENFLLAIYQRKLVVDVEGVIIDRDTMEGLIYDLQGKKYDVLKNYYSVLKDVNTKTFKLDERFECYGFKAEDGVLLLSKGERANRSVLMTRAAGMKILDRKRISGSIQFNGIFQATGTRFNEMLQKMENPNHNDWIAERYEEDSSLAEKLLRDMYQFMKDKVMENYEEKIEKQIDAFGISDFLPNRKKDQKDQSEDGDAETLNNTINQITLRERKSSLGEVETPDQALILKTLERTGIIDGGEGGAGSSKNRETKNKGGKFAGGVGTLGGNNKEDESGKKRIIEKDKNFTKSEDVFARILEENYMEGSYKLIFTSKKDMDKIKLEINLIGETTRVNDFNIKGVEPKKYGIYFNKNNIKIDNIKQGINYDVGFNIPYKNRMKMDVKIYEYK